MTKGFNGGMIGIPTILKKIINHSMNVSTQYNPIFVLI